MDDPAKWLKPFDTKTLLWFRWSAQDRTPCDVSITYNDLVHHQRRIPEPRAWLKEAPMRALSETVAEQLKDVALEASARGKAPINYLGTANEQGGFDAEGVPRRRELVWYEFAHVQRR